MRLPRNQAVPEFPKGVSLGDGDDFSSSSRNEQGGVHHDDLPGRWLTGLGFQPDG
jgi:hypothetical protein